MISGIKTTYDPRHMKRLLNSNKQHGSTTKIIKVKTKN